MANGCTHVFLLCWFCFLFLTGLNLFSRGFLLRRVVLTNTSTCSNGTDLHLKTLALNTTVDQSTGMKSNCWLPARFNKAVVIVIDGLRFDFIHYNESVADSEALPFQNKLILVHELLRDQPEHSALFRFVADPPTTTMQRIKGLITGSLPTFIDISDNFDSYEIVEDNIVHQMTVINKSVIFLGDDTWVGLVPRKFKRSFPFPSFNVKDLHTVDDGIAKHLLPEMLSKDWDVLLAHFLGVDHCGHRYGPYHSAMAEKLSQMNDMLRMVVVSLDSDTVLFVMGDHGMTKSGDHGGDSMDEISSALFVYSKKKLHNFKNSLPPEINQVDFVPTFALLMGIPIPFGNLGKAIPDFFITEAGDGSSNQENDLRNGYFGALALYSNMKQVKSYLKQYNSISRELAQDQETFFKLEQLLTDTENVWKLLPFLSPAAAVESLSSIKGKCTAYLNLARLICQKVWAQFDLLSMITGLCIFAASLVLISGQVFLSLPISPKPAAVLFVFAIVGTALQIRGAESTVSVVIAAASSLCYMICAWRNNVPEAVTSQDQFISCKVVFLCGISSFSFLFSNSFVINEASLSSYFLIAILWWEVLTTSPSFKKPIQESKRKNKIELLTRSRVLCIAFALLSTLCVRTACIFWKCREEQWWCEGSIWLRSLANIPADSAEYVAYRNWRFFLSVCSVATIIGAIRWLMRKAGNMNGFSPAVLCASYVPAVLGIGICFYWALQGLSSTVMESALLPQQLYIPNVVFSVAAISILVLFLSPLCIYTIREKVSEIGPALGSDIRQLFPQVFRHLKANWQDYFSSAGVRAGSDPKPLMVYGLASVFSASLITMITILMLVLMLLSSDGLAPAFLLLFVAKALILYCLASLRENIVLNQSHISKVPWSWVLMWSFFASVEFYATGHQQTFPALYWEAATIGSDGNFGGHILPGTKVLLNTFSSSVLSGIGLPLLFLWPFTNHVIFHKENRFPAEVSDNMKKGEFFMFENPALFDGLFHLTCKYFVIQGVKLFVSMAAAALLRRHLMVWKIFAPRFIFEAVNFCITIPAVLCGFLLVMSVHAALTSWIKKLGQHEHSS